MPEITDVQVFKEYLDATSLHQPVEQVVVSNTKVLYHISASAFEQALKGRSFTKSRRHGKYLFVYTDSDPILLLHFGMTGRLKYQKDKEDEPRHSRVRFHFSTGSHLSFLSQRRIARTGILTDIEAFLNQKNIGPDALHLEKKDYTRIIANSNAKVKSTLMDQSKMAGLGNVYSDEVLFQAGLHPDKKASELTEEQLEAIYKATREVCLTAIKLRINTDRFPATYLTPIREEGARCPVCNGTIQSKKINSRTAYFCPEHQSD